MGPIIRWFPDLSSWLLLFCSTSLLPAIVTYLWSDKGISNTPCVLIYPTQRRSRLLIFFFTVLCWKYKFFKKSCLTHDYQPQAGLMPISRKIRWIYLLLYRLQLDKTAIGFAKHYNFFLQHLKMQLLAWKTLIHIEMCYIVTTMSVESSDPHSNKFPCSIQQMLLSL